MAYARIPTADRPVVQTIVYRQSDARLKRYDKHPLKNRIFTANLLLGVKNAKNGTP